MKLGECQGCVHRLFVPGAHIFVDGICNAAANGIMCCIFEQQLPDVFHCLFGVLIP